MYSLYYATKLQIKLWGSVVEQLEKNDHQSLDYRIHLFLHYGLQPLKHVGASFEALFRLSFGVVISAASFTALHINSSSKVKEDLNKIQMKLLSPQKNLSAFINSFVLTFLYTLNFPIQMYKNWNKEDDLRIYQQLKSDLADIEAEMGEESSNAFAIS